MRRHSLFLLFLSVLTLTAVSSRAERLVLAGESYGKNIVAIVNDSGEVLWQHKVRGGQHDVHLLDNGNILFQDGWTRIVEMTLDKKEVWSYDSSKMNGNAGKPVEVHAFQRLPNGHTMIAESGPKRIIEVDREGKIHATINLTVDNPHPHRDTRLVRKTTAGTYLVCHEADGVVREYDKDSTVVWEHNVKNKAYGVLRLKNGNTLIATGGGNSVIEVDKSGKTVWEIAKTVPKTSIELKWTTMLTELPTGNFIIGNCHAGPNNPQIFEITRDKKVVWQFNNFKTFGNGLACSQVLSDAQAKAIRAQLAAAPTPKPPELPAQGIRATASHCWQTDSVEAMADGQLPAHSDDHDIPRMTWWPQRGSQEWVQYDFAKPQKVSSVGVYWFDDSPRGGCRVPASWKLLYRDGNAWKPVTAKSAFGTAEDSMQIAEFAAVETTGLRIDVQLQANMSSGILEWQVNGKAQQASSVQPTAPAPPPSPHPLPKMSPAEGSEFYADNIHPLLEEHCFKCHGGRESVKAEFYLTSRAGLMRGGTLGPAFDANSPGKSFLLEMLSYKDTDHQMPPKGKLSDEIRATFRQWIEAGAPYDSALEKPLPVHSIADDPTKVTDKTKNYWAYRQVQQPAVPTVNQAAWQQNPIDAFVMAGLEKAGIKPVPAASKQALIRRAYYDLIGLPPSPERVQEFINDASPNAYETLVDELLAMPQYGEKWGRHWLDVVRFAESNGYERDSLKPEAWRYRDYVVKAFNEDKPYDRFITEQIAGDELQPVSADSLTATGFQRLGVWDDEPADRELHKYDVLDGVVSTTSQAFLAMTVGCARCHSHKIDPLPIADYYSFLSFFHNSTSIGKGNSNLRPVPLASDGATDVDQLKRELKEIEARFVSALKKQRPELLPGDGKPQNWSVLSDSRKGAKNWRYSLNKPGDNWMSANFDDGKWKQGQGGFGTAGTPAAVIGTTWNTTGIWLRRTIDLAAIPANVTMWVHHDEDAEVWVNGNPIAKFSGYAKEYIAHPLDQGEAQAFRPGKNVIAVFCKQTSGGQYIDVGFEVKGGFDLQALMKQHGRTILGKEFATYQKKQAELKQPKKATGSGHNVMAIAERGNVETRILRRGNPRLKADLVQPAFPSVLSPPEPQIESRNGSSGRRYALAQWLGSTQNPLTARVMVNRIWQHHFGRGIVRSTSDFGRAGEKPTHQALLDWLAADFMANGWTIKRMHRQMMLSKTYRLASTASDEPLAKDPANNLFWRYNMRRLTAEEIRDSILSLTGQLSPQVGGKSYFSDIPADVLASSSTKGGKWGKSSPEERNRRSLYILVRRSLLDPMLNAHDMADTDNSTAERFVTTVPAQSLAMLNSAFANDKAALFAKRVIADGGDQIERAFSLALARPPSAKEKALCTEYVTAVKQDEQLNDEEALTRFCLLAMNMNEFIYLD